MRYPFLLVTTAVSASLLTLIAASQTDYFSSGFYTRGTEPASYIDQGGSFSDPFYIPVQNWSVLPRMTLSATRDDNFFLNSKDPQKGTSIDFIPGVLLIYGRPDHNHLYADFSTIIPLYSDVDELDDAPSYLLTLGGVYKTGKSQVTGRVGYRKSENADTLAGARIVQEDIVGNLGLEHRISTKSSVGLDGTVEMHDYEESSYIDYNRYYGAGRYYRRLSGKSETFLQLGIGRDDLDTPENIGDADFYDISLGLRGKQSAKTTISGRVGYMWRQYDDERFQDVDSWIASIGAETTPFGLTTFTSELTADIRPAINSIGAATVDQRLLVGVNRRLFSERLRGNASVYVGFVDYYGLIDLPDDVTIESDLVYDGREDEYWGYSLGLDWWTRHKISVGLAYSYTENRGSQNGSIEDQERTSFDSGLWMIRMSWNY